MSLQIVRQFNVTKAFVQETERCLREAGREGYERFVLWSGRVTIDNFEVLTLHVPKQTSYKFKDSLCVHIDGTELHRLNCWLFERGQAIGVQVHGHPGKAYHSETDDTYPIVTALGGLSIVVPDFCRGSLFDPGTMIYRLDRNGWRELQAQELRDLVSVN